MQTAASDELAFVFGELALTKTPCPGLTPVSTVCPIQRCSERQVACRTSVHPPFPARTFNLACQSSSLRPLERSWLLSLRMESSALQQPAQPSN